MAQFSSSSQQNRCPRVLLSPCMTFSFRTISWLNERLSLIKLANIMKWSSGIVSTSSNFAIKPYWNPKIEQKIETSVQRQLNLQPDSQHPEYIHWTEICRMGENLPILSFALGNKDYSWTCHKVAIRSWGYVKTYKQWDLHLPIMWLGFLKGIHTYEVFTISSYHVSA